MVLKQRVLESGFEAQIGTTRLCVVFLGDGADAEDRAESAASSGIATPTHRLLVNNMHAYVALGLGEAASNNLRELGQERCLVLY